MFQSCRYGYHLLLDVIPVVAIRRAGVGARSISRRIAQLFVLFLGKFGQRSESVRCNPVRVPQTVEGFVDWAGPLLRIAGG